MWTGLGEGLLQGEVVLVIVPVLFVPFPGPHYKLCPPQPMAWSKGWCLNLQLNKKCKTILGTPVKSVIKVTINERKLIISDSLL